MGSKLIKGFRDIYPLADSLIEDSILWSYINKIIRKRLETYNFEEIITPSIENIDTFKKGMGNNTDIVSKEMYEFMLYKDGEIKEKANLTSSLKRMKQHKIPVFVLGIGTDEGSNIPLPEGGYVKDKDIERRGFEALF